jgi:carbamoyltransferase
MALNIIGISAYHHDSACCLMQDGNLVWAAEEERFSRKPHDPSLPWRAFRTCVDQTGLTLPQIDCVAYYEDPVKKLARQLWVAQYPTISSSMRAQLLAEIKESDRLEYDIRERLGYEGPIKIVDHHHAHAASSFYFSGFGEAAIMTVDGVGEWTTTALGRADRQRGVDIFEEVHFPDSLGILYSTITAYLGFQVYHDEDNVMALAPYGKPRYRDQIEYLVKSADRLQFRLNLDYFDFLSSGRLYSDRLVEFFGQPAREPASDILPFHRDIACSLQQVIEDILLEKVQYLHTQTGSQHLCMAGGVALNSVATGKILRQGSFSKLFIPPAAGNAGSTLGAAAVAYRDLEGNAGDIQPLQHVYLGPRFSSDEIKQLLGTSIAVSDFRDNIRQLLQSVVDRLLAGQVIAWFHGRMEFGPTALGARSILADPRLDYMRNRIKVLVKQQDDVRPFASAVLADRAQEHYDLKQLSPFMPQTCKVTSDLALPAITHIDDSARVQTVDTTDGRFYELLKCFDERTHCPILLHTSFHMPGEPIVCTPVDAVACFILSDIDALVLEDLIIDREAIPPDWKAFLSVANPFADNPAADSQTYLRL